MTFLFLIRVALNKYFLVGYNMSMGFKKLEDFPKFRHQNDLSIYSSDWNEDPCIYLWELIIFTCRI